MKIQPYLSQKGNDTSRQRNFILREDWRKGENPMRLWSQVEASWLSGFIRSRDVKSDVIDIFFSPPPPLTPSPPPSHSPFSPSFVGH